MKVTSNCNALLFKVTSPALPVSQEARQIQTLLSCLSDPAEDFLQAVHCALHCSPCMILYTKQQIKNGCILPHKNFISSVSFNALYTMCYILFPLSVCLSCLLDITLVGQAHGPFSRSCLRVPSVRHRRDRQTGDFHCPICPVMF